jgi:hypothetical protein
VPYRKEILESGRGSLTGQEKFERRYRGALFGAMESKSLETRPGDSSKGDGSQRRGNLQNLKYVVSKQTLFLVVEIRDHSDQYLSKSVVFGPKWHCSLPTYATGMAINRIETPTLQNHEGAQSFNVRGTFSLSSPRLDISVAVAIWP